MALSRTALGGDSVVTDISASSPYVLTWILLKSWGFQVDEMSCCQFSGVMAIQTRQSIKQMNFVFTRIVTVVLRCPEIMAGLTLRVDIDRAGPGRRGLAAVTSGAGAGAAVAAGRAALGVKAGQDSNIGGAVMGRTIMAGTTDWSDRTEAQYGVFGMSHISVWRGGS